MTFVDSMRYVHILGGTIALATFWTAATLRKGSGPHIGVGRSYLIAMCVVMVSAIPLAVAAFRAGTPVFGTFLLYLVVITGTACWTAWRAIRDKRQPTRYAGTIYQALAWVNIVAGAGVLLLGIAYGIVILMALSLVGLISGPVMLRFARQGPDNTRWWLREHYLGIIGGGVATHIAFLSLGLTRFVPAEHAQTIQYIAWFGPLTAAVAARMWLNRKYETSEVIGATRKVITADGRT